MSQRSADGSSRPPAQAENDAWFAYRAICHKQGREPDERTFRDAWKWGAQFTFGATSSLAPSLEAFSRWLDYITSWSAPISSSEGGYDDPGPAAARMTTEQMDGADKFYP